MFFFRKVAAGTQPSPTGIEAICLCASASGIGLHCAVSYDNIFRMPERVFRIKGAVLKHGILDVLEGVFAFHPHIGKTQPKGAHHKIFAFGIAVFHFDLSGRPAKLRRKNIAAADNGVRALPQRLDPVKLRILNCDMIGIPESGPADPSKEQSFTIISRLP